ncbi:MAG: DUF2339 domain-containing protein [Terracidiphilus sp.]
MDSLFFLAIGFVVGIPIVAIVALVRAGTARRLAEDSAYESRDKISDLRGEIADLRRELKRVSERVAEQGPAPPQVPDQALREPVNAAAPAESTLDRAAADFRNAAEPEAAFQTIRDAAPAAPFRQPEPEPVVLRIESEAGAFFEEALPEALSAQAIMQEAEMADAAPLPQAAEPPSTRTPVVEPPAYSIPAFASYEATQPRKSFAERLRATLPLEEVLGMNLFAKIGIVFLVLGFALLGRLAMVSMGPGERVAMIYAVAAAMLAGGIRLEKKERYRLVGRTGIGGGWALLFFTTYAMGHVAAMTVISSNTLDCVLMLGVAIAMVAHTLGYKSQLVTGLAFLLAFSTVALSEDSVYALVAGVILALGIVAIALRMGWFELEVFGILASYANHFYWLYKLYPDGVAGHAFPQFLPSVLILVAYWAIFRISYVARKIRKPRDETISTIAALLNTMLLLGVMKFQATHPEFAFYALLALGAAEFLFGQLPATRRRRPAFILLTLIGVLLIFASVPFKFSGNNIALLWMIAAEALLVTGIAQFEVVFRRLGLFAGLLTGLLILYEARNIVALRQQSEAPLVKDGILLLTASVLFYLNAHFIRPRWKALFEGFDGRIATAQSYIGCVSAFLGLWAIFTADWTALSWAALMLGAALGKRYLDSNHLVAQAWILSAAVVIRAVAVNGHLDAPYPHRLAARLVTLPILALAYYLAAWALSRAKDVRFYVRSTLLWAGSALLALLVWLELAPQWVAPVWVALAVALALIARRLRLADLTYQEHVLGVAGVAQLAGFNLEAPTALARYVPLLLSAAAFYAVSRYCTQSEADYRRPAAWLHTWTATALIAALAWSETPQPWLAAIWALFALALAVVDRIFDVEELPYQAHVLALLAVVRAVTLNLFLVDQWHGIDLRLITVSIVAGVLYALARWVRLPAPLRDSDARHGYTWVGSGLVAWMLWSELEPVSVALGLAVFGLLLYEAGAWRGQKQLRLQAYTLLTASFARIFFVNLTAATLPGEVLSSRIYTVAPLAVIYFYVWARMQTSPVKSEAGRWEPGDLIAYFGAGSIAALLYYQTSPEWIVVAWAVVALVLLGASLLLDREVFSQQANLLVAAIAVRGLAHNIFGASYFVAGGWQGRFSVLSLTCALLFAALPIAFRLRDRYTGRPMESPLSRLLAVNRPEQMLFFAPVVLITFMIAVKMNPGMVTLSWGIEGVVVILLGLAASQRSYRLTGLLLLLLCVGKIVFRDAWMLGERDRYITFIVLGAALTLVSTLYSKYRDSVRRLL